MVKSLTLLGYHCSSASLSLRLSAHPLLCPLGPAHQVKRHCLLEVFLCGAHQLSVPRKHNLRSYTNNCSNRVEVPGGEQGYVSPTGAIMYTGPHSASMPGGSFVGGFTAKNITIEGQSYEKEEHAEHEEDKDCVKQVLLNWNVPGTRKGKSCLTNSCSAQS
jgi:hypothetical protein